MVKLRELGWIEAAGAAEVKLFTVICGRPLLYAQVIPILRVRAAIWLGARLNLIVVGLFLPRNWMAGTTPGESTPAKKVGVSQGDIRTSDGCICAILSPLRRPAGVPSHSPIRKIADGVV